MLGISSAQEAVTVSCADVLDNGNVTVWWTPPSDTVDFQKYEIYFSPDGSDFYIVGVNFDVTRNHFDHIDEPMANLGSRWYYIRSIYEDGAVDSDTIQTIFLQILVSDDDNEASLYWNSLSDPLPGGSSDWYHIFLQNESEEWVLIDSAQSEPFKYKVFECDIWIDFRVVLVNENGCESNSNIAGNQFKDITLPDKPVFDSVSINYINDIPRIVLGWETTVSQDVVGYILYRQQGIQFFEFDTVYGINTTFYIDTLVPACDTVFTYAMASIDSCGNKSPGTFLNPLKNIRLYDVIYDPCMLEATISFEPFIDYEADSISFELVGNSINGFQQNVKKLNGLNSDEINNRSPGEIITVIDEDLRIGRIYEYYIREIVYKNGSYYTTSSCIKSIYAYGYDKPTHSYLANASILVNNHARLTIAFDTVVLNSNLEVWRSDPNEELMSNYLMTISTDTLQKEPFSITDTSANGLLGSYLYSIRVMDSCNKLVLQSNVLKTMHLSVFIKDNDHNMLQWNRFEGWIAGVSKYYIYRMESTIEPTTPIDSVLWYDNEYTDDISGLDSSVGNLVYWVQAEERDGNDFGFKEKSNSNRAQVIPESDIYFPNAFKPGGELDNVFKPIFRFLNGSNYLFQIYNRWGQLIFETTDPYEGWDGTYNGSFVMQGTYIYKFQYLDVYGDSFNQQGTVTVIY